MPILSTMAVSSLGVVTMAATSPPAATGVCCHSQSLRLAPATARLITSQTGSGIPRHPSILARRWKGLGRPTEAGHGQGLGRAPMAEHCTSGLYWPPPRLGQRGHSMWDGVQRLQLCRRRVGNPAVWLGRAPVRPASATRALSVPERPPTVGNHAIVLMDLRAQLPFLSLNARGLRRGSILITRPATCPAPQPQETQREGS